MFTWLLCTNLQIGQYTLLANVPNSVASVHRAHVQSKYQEFLNKKHGKFTFKISFAHVFFIFHLYSRKLNQENFLIKNCVHGTRTINTYLTDESFSKFFWSLIQKMPTFYKYHNCYGLWGGGLKTHIWWNKNLDHVILTFIWVLLLSEVWSRWVYRIVSSVPKHFSGKFALYKYY